MSVFVILYSNSAQPLPSLPNAHHWRILAKETYNKHNTITGIQDCPLEGCWTRIEIPLHTSSIPSPFLFFPYHNTGDYLQEAFIYGGCRYWSCQIEATNHGGAMFANLTLIFSFPSSIPGMINDEWEL